MDQKHKTQTNPPNIIWSLEKTSPTIKAQGCYRSRIYTSDININPLIAACDQLLSLTINLKNTEHPENEEKLRQDLAHEIRAFEHQAKLANYENEIIVAARYAICSLIDETIFQTSWGENSWSEKNLLALFHNEKDGGEIFFVILNSALEDITTNLHLIELLYLCLNLGFTGKYKNNKYNQNELPAINDKLYQIIKQYSYRNPKNILIPNNKEKKIEQSIDPASRRTVTDSKKLFGIAIAIAIVTSGLIYLGFSLKLNQLSAPIYNTLEQLQKNTSENNL